MTYSLGASHAPRWMVCAGAPRMAKANPVPEQADANRDAGKDVHHVAEQVLKSLRDGQPASPRQFVGTVGPYGTYITTDMAVAVGVYIQDVLTIARMIDGETGPLPSLRIEHRHDLSWVGPGMVCIVDASIYSSYSKTLSVWDYKNGADPRDPEYDWQMIANALGEAASYPDVQTLDIRIVQPNAWQDEAVKSWRIDVDTLRGLGLKMRTGAELAQQPDAPLTPGMNCKRCKGRAVCPAFKAYTERLIGMTAGYTVPPQHLQPEDVALELDQLGAAAKAVKARTEALDELAFMQADKQAVNIPGYKLANRRSIRKITNESDFAEVARQMGYSDELLYHEPKLLSPAQLENVGVLPELVEQYAEKPDNGKQLVPLSNKAPAAASWLIETFSKVK